MAEPMVEPTAGPESPEAPAPPAARLRWRVVESAPEQQQLFPTPPERIVGTGEFRGLEFLHVHARRIINEVPKTSPVPFRHTINAYRGCSHACTYCFARPTHDYLGLDSDVDFDRVIVVKVNAVERLRAELAPKRWSGESIAMGTNTDPYQRAEGKYHLTQGIIDVLSAAGNPFSILTKGTLILRDIDALAEAARRTAVETSFSIGTVDEEVWKLTEPGTPHPMRRIEAVAKLNDAGVPCSVLIGPILPGLSDRPEQLDAVVGACVDAGARSIAPILLHLRPGVKEHYLGWLQGVRPDLVAEHEERYRRSYASTEQRNALTATVRDLIAKHRRRAGRGGSNRAMPQLSERFEHPR
jgi:DNA repair photolyase